MSKHSRKEPPQACSGSPLRLGKTSASPQNLIGSKVSQTPGSYECKGFHRGLSPFVRLFLRGLSPFARIAHWLFVVAKVIQGHGFYRAKFSQRSVPICKGSVPVCTFCNCSDDAMDKGCGRRRSRCGLWAVME